jgi:SMI1 / KNR4 family (SUKH-1)
MTIRASAAWLFAAAALCACGREPTPANAPKPAPVAQPARAVDMVTLLRDFDRDVIERLRRIPDAQRMPEEREIIARGTSLNAPATQEDLDALAKKIGKPLPPSYRAFLAASNGMVFHGALTVVTMHAAAAVEPITKQGIYPLLALWRAMPDVAVPLDPTAGGPLPGAALARAWVLSSVDDLDVYFIFPDLAGPNGEWPVWFFGPKNPGAYGYPSFGEMFLRERPRALSVLDTRIARANQKPK